MNIGDIAKLAGVSRAAVSRYLNNGYVSAEKKEKIRKVIEDTGYKPSFMAQTLRTKKTKLIGVVLPRIHSDSVSRVVAGIERALRPYGYQMILATTDNKPEKELDYLRVFSKNRVDGVVFIATVLTSEHEKVMAEMTVPVVIVGQQFSNHCCVFHDDYGAACALTEYILEGGRKRLIYIGVLREDRAAGIMRGRGVLDAAKKGGAPIDEGRIGIADFSTESGYAETKRLLQANPEADAVICATDTIAVGAMQALKDAGKRIPGDIWLAGFGDSNFGRYTEPALTTVHYYYHKSGEQAVDILMNKIQCDDTEVVSRQLGFELVIRSST